MSTGVSSRLDAPCCAEGPSVAAPDSWSRLASTCCLTDCVEVVALALEVESAAMAGKHCAHRNTAPMTGGMNRIIDTVSIKGGVIDQP